MKKKKQPIQYHVPKRHKSRRGGLRRALQSIFVPGRHNSYRPQLVRSWVLILVLISFVTGQISVTMITNGQVKSGHHGGISASEILSSTNSFRSKAGVQPLHLNEQLANAANAKVSDMFTHQYWSHVSPDGVQPWHWVTQTGYNYQSAGENLAKNFHTAGATVQAWYDSPTHRDNLLNSKYSEVGFATASGLLNGEQATITVAMYGAPMYVGGVTLSAAPKAAYIGQQQEATFSSAGVNASLGVIDRIGLAVQSMPPLVVGIVVLLGIMLVVLSLAHRTRTNLPKSHVRHHLRHNHALIKALGVFVFMVSIFWLYGGGQVQSWQCTWVYQLLYSR